MKEMKNNSCGYVPALTENILCWKGKFLLPTPKILVSAFYGIKLNLRKDWNLPKEIMIIGDSGGFQKLTLPKFNLDALDILRWQEENCNIGMTLDVPPYNIIDDSKPFFLNDKDFNSAMMQSYNYSKIYYEKRQNKDMKIYNCIHGNTLQRINKWFAKLDEFKFEGYALAPKPQHNPLSIARFLCFFLEKGINKNLHVLAVSGKNTLPVVAYLSKYIKNLTYDSSAFSTANGYDYLNPLTFCRNIHLGEKNTTKLTAIPCDCPSCKITTLDEIYKGTKSRLPIMLHNMYQITKYDAILRSLRMDEIAFREFINVYCSEKTTVAIDYINYALLKGVKAAEVKYQKYFQETKQVTQRSIFGF